MRVNLADTGNYFYVTVVYAYNSSAGREALWTNLQNIGASITDPWIIMGDLNTTLFCDERVRSGVVVNQSTAELRGVVDALNVKDLKYNGMKLTWCNNHTVDRLYCKLDRALINLEWVQSFPFSEAQFLPPLSSDHSPCIIRMHTVKRRENYMFKYCKMWSLDPEFKNAVSRACSVQVEGTPMYCLVKKLQAVKCELKKLHKNDYAKLSSRVSTLKKQLEDV